MGRRKNVKREPALLACVLKAVTKLNDHHGSTALNIFDYVRSELKTSKNKSPVKSHKLIDEVQKALEHGVNEGLLQIKPGKYKLASQTILPSSDSSETETTKATSEKQITHATRPSLPRNQSKSCKKREKSKHRRQSRKSHKPTTADKMPKQADTCRSTSRSISPIEHRRLPRKSTSQVLHEPTPDETPEQTVTFRSRSRSKSPIQHRRQARKSNLQVSRESTPNKTPDQAVTCRSRSTSRSTIQHRKSTLQVSHEPETPEQAVTRRSSSRSILNIFRNRYSYYDQINYI